MKKIKLILLAVIAASVLTACSAKKNHENTAVNDYDKPTATTAADNIMNDAEDMVDDAGNAVGDAAKGTGNVVGDAVEGAGDVVGDAAKDVGDTVNDIVDRDNNNQ